MSLGQADLGQFQHIPIRYSELRVQDARWHSLYYSFKCACQDERVELALKGALQCFSFFPSAFCTTGVCVVCLILG